MDKTVFLGWTIDSRLKDSHGRCAALSSETLTLCCWPVCVINWCRNSSNSERFSWLLCLDSSLYFITSADSCFKGRPINIEHNVVRKKRRKKTDILQAFFIGHKCCSVLLLQSLK